MATNERITRFYFYPGHQKRFEGEMRFLLWIIIRLLCGRRRIGETVIYFSMATGGKKSSPRDTNTNDFEREMLPCCCELFRKIFPPPITRVFRTISIRFENLIPPKEDLKTNPPLQTSLSEYLTATGFLLIIRFLLIISSRCRLLL